MLTERVSTTSTRNPSTDCAPTRAASHVAERLEPMWIETTASHSWLSLSYAFAKSPGLGADVVGSCWTASSFLKNWSPVRSTPSRNDSLPKSVLRGTTSIP
jgi:hypothetical protein